MIVFNPWMSHSIAPQVTLPKMTAGETYTVVQALKTSHDALPQEAVTKPVTRCMNRLHAASVPLGPGGNRAIRRARSRAGRSAEGAGRRERYYACQRAWSALLQQLGVWRETRAVARLSDSQQSALDRLLPAGGLDFDRRDRGRVLWSAGASLLTELQSSGAEEAIVKLGGADVLAHVKRAQNELGASLGVSAPMAAPVAQGPGVAAPLAVVNELLRAYVLKVYALLDPEVEGSDAVVGALLAPLFDVAASRTRATVKNTETEEEPSTPEAVVAPSPAPANDVTPAQRPTGTG